ncbi:MAG: DNA-binding response regulator [Saprospiraceae bacterium]
MQTTRIFAIDDDDNYLRSLEGLFKPYAKRYELVGSFSDVGDDDGVADMLDTIGVRRPDVVLMDYSFLMVRRPDDFGLELTRKILKKVPSTKMIMLVGDQDDPDEKRTNKLKRSFNAGACAYLSKGEPLHWLVGISEAMNGDQFIDPDTLKVLVGSFKAGQAFGLTAREMEVIKYLGEDKIVKEIADVMKGADGRSIAVHGVNFHIKNIKVKMSAYTLHGIVAKACRGGII